MLRFGYTTLNMDFKMSKVIKDWKNTCISFLKKIYCITKNNNIALLIYEEPKIKIEQE